MTGNSKNVSTPNSTEKDIQPTKMDIFEKTSEWMKNLNELLNNLRVWIINVIKWIPMWYLKETWYKLPPLCIGLYWWDVVPNLLYLNDVSKLEDDQWCYIRSKCDRYTIVYLNWLKNISPKVLGQLSHTRIYRLELNWLESISDEQLNALKDAYPVTLEWIDSLPDNQIKILSESVESFLNCYFGNLVLSEEQKKNYIIFWGRVFKKSETIVNNWMLIDSQSNKVYKYDDWSTTLQQYSIKDKYIKNVMDFFHNPLQK